MSKKTENNDKREYKKLKQQELENQRKVRKIVTFTGIAIAIVLIGLLIYNRASAPGIDFKLDTQPAQGNAAAPVKIVEFGDFKCPSCQYFSQSIYPQLKKDYLDTGKAQLYFVNYPFIGPDSTTAALASESIYHQNASMFWNFYDTVYKNQGSEQTNWATPEKLVELAKQSAPGIDYDLLLKDIQNQTYLSQVKDDYDLGRKAGVNSTPTLFINGQLFTDFSNYDKLKQMIDKAENKGK